MSVETQPGGDAARQKHVFISHASLDGVIAGRVRDDLEADGINCWMAPRDVPAGADHAVAIHDAIAACPVFLLLVSRRSMASVDVDREVHLASRARATIIPLRLEAVDLTASLTYLLANVQHLNAIPRVEPMLGRVRAEIRRALKKGGTVVPSTHRPRFQTAWAIAGAWIAVAALSGLVMEVIRRFWFNMLPYGIAVLETLRTPYLALLVALTPLLALVLQFWANRNPSRIPTLDALISLAPGAARARLAGAASILLAGAIAATFIPTVSVRLADTPVPAGSDFVRVESCTSRGSYVAQQTTHYRLDFRVGPGNPTSDYAVAMELAPYATPDGVEFCDIWLDRALASGRRELAVDHQQSKGRLSITGLREAFPGRRSLIFTVRHYRDSTPKAAVTASLAHGSVQPKDHEAIATPLR